MAPILELGAIADGGNDRRSRFRANALDLGDPLAGLAFEKYPIVARVPCRK